MTGLVAALEELSRFRPLTEAEAATLHASIMRRSEGRRPARTAAVDLLRRIAEQYGTTTAEITGTSRIQYICHARQAYMAGLRNLGWSYSKIARVLRRDHSTVMHGVEAHHARQAALC